MQIVNRRCWLWLLLALTLAAAGCGRLDPPPVEPAQDVLAEGDVDETEPPQLPAEVEPETESDEGQLSEQQAGADTSRITREQALIAGLTIFVLAVFVGFEVITKVPPTLHTPLMSGSNAISGITIVGAALMAGGGLSWAAMLLGFFAVVLATVNVVGGFMVTDRMLGMFKRK